MRAQLSRGRVLCGDWAGLQQALKEGERLAFEASKQELHVWSGDEPRPEDRCQCGARTWG
jgi:hypothetical protein